MQNDLNLIKSTHRFLNGGSDKPIRKDGHNEFSVIEMLLLLIQELF